MKPEQETTGISFPALTFIDGWLGAIESLDDFARSSKVTVREGLFEHLVLVDSNLNEFHIASVKKVRTLFNLNFYSLLQLVRGNPRWLVEIGLGPPTHLSLSEVKRRIASCFEWQRDVYGIEAFPEEFRDRIARADSIGDVLAAFGESAVTCPPFLVQG